MFKKLYKLKPNKPSMRSWSNGYDSSLPRKPSFKKEVLQSQKTGFRSLCERVECFFGVKLRPFFLKERD